MWVINLCYPCLRFCVKKSLCSKAKSVYKKGPVPSYLIYLWIVSLAQYDELQDISGIPTAFPWTKEDYDEAVQNLLLSQGAQKHGEFGITSPCVLNSLKSFHCVGQFPLDPLHDVLEKVFLYNVFRATRYKTTSLPAALN
jgi:hypothetical protein